MRSALLWPLWGFGGAVWATQIRGWVLAGGLGSFWGLCGWGFSWRSLGLCGGCFWGLHKSGVFGCVGVLSCLCAFGFVGFPGELCVHEKGPPFCVGGPGGRRWFVWVGVQSWDFVSSASLRCFSFESFQRRSFLPVCLWSLGSKPLFLSGAFILFSSQALNFMGGPVCVVLALGLYRGLLEGSLCLWRVLFWRCFVLDAESFMLEVVEFMGVLGVSDLEGSGLRFPASGWDWLDCCHACAWLAFQGNVLPGHLVSRMLLGPPNPVVALWSRWELSGRTVSLFDLAG